MAWPAIIAAVGAAVSIYGQYQAGLDAADAADKNAQNAKLNAQLAKERAKENSRRIRLEGRKQIGSMQAASGASGLGTGSAIDAIAEAMVMIEHDALTVEHGGSLEELKYFQEAKNYESLASSSRTTGGLQAAGTLLSSGAKFYKEY